MIDYYCENVEKVTNVSVAEVKPTITEGSREFEHFDRGYIDAYNKFLENKKNEKSDFLKFNNPILSDNLEDEISYINVNLFKKSELTNYYNLAKNYDFNLTTKINDWVEKLIELIYK